MVTKQTKINKNEESSDKNMEKLIKLQTAGFEALDKRFDEVQKTLDTHTKILDSHTKRLDGHKEAIGNVIMDMLEVKSDVKELKFKIGLILPDKVDKKHFVDLEQRVRVLEKA